MRLRALVALLAVLALVGSCSSRSDGSGNARSTAVAATPPATVAGATTTPVRANIQPAFPKLPKLERPVAMVEIPGQQRMLVVLQEGRILSFAKDPGAMETTVVLDQSGKTSRTDNEEGLLGLALDPNFAKNGYIYVYYSAKGGQRRTVLSRLTTLGAGAGLKADPATELIIPVREPQGRAGGVRARRDAVPRVGRRRLRGRPTGERAGSRTEPVGEHHPD